MTNTVQDILQNNLKSACGVLRVSPWLIIMCGLPLKKGRRALCISLTLDILRRLLISHRP